MTARSLALALLLTAFAAPSFADEKGPDRGRKLLPQLFESAAAAAADATVRIQVDKKDVILGTVVAKNGYILTKGSELIGKEGKLKTPLVCLLRDGSVFDAEVVGYEVATDLMMLKVDAEVLPTVSFAPAKTAEPGNFVVATGLVNYKTGDPEAIGPVSVGVVSSGSRQLYFPETAIENANRGFLGIIFEPTVDPKNTRIDEVKNDSAKKAGLKKGDTIVAAGGQAVGSRKELVELMNDTRPGDMMEVKIKRKVKDGEDEEKTLKFKLIPPSLMDRGALQNVMGGDLSNRRGGFPKVIQHDTVLTPQQCGGPLVDLDGKVLGLNIARAGRVESWALPAEVLNPLIKEFQDGKHPYKAKAVVAKEEKKDDKKDDKKTVKTADPPKKDDK